MNINEILENIQNLKEKSTIELKKASSELPKSFWETYSSFANTKGGYIILGIDEQKEGNIITGVTNPEKIETDVNDDDNDAICFKFFILFSFGFAPVRSSINGKVPILRE